jgi:hypothetical protein
VAAALSHALNPVRLQPPTGCAQLLAGISHPMDVLITRALSHDAHKAFAGFGMGRAAYFASAALPTFNHPSIDVVGDTS